MYAKWFIDCFLEASSCYYSIQSFLLEVPLFYEHLSYVVGARSNWQNQNHNWSTWTVIRLCDISHELPISPGFSASCDSADIGTLDFGSSWKASWLFRLDSFVNCLPQCWHFRLSSGEWTSFTWLLNMLYVLNFMVHCLQLYSILSCTARMWCLTCWELLNPLPHLSQYLTSPRPSGVCEQLCLRWSL